MSERDGETPVGIPVMPGRNGGTLRRGGINPKHNGGRPRKIVRDMLLAEFVEQLPILKKECGKPGKITRKEFAEMCAKYGLGSTITETDTEGNDVQPFTFVIDSPSDDSN